MNIVCVNCHWCGEPIRHDEVYTVFKAPLQNFYWYFHGIDGQENCCWNKYIESIKEKVRGDCDVAHTEGQD